MNLHTSHILVLGTADWNQAIATNQHYTVRELAAGQQAQITFIESLGLRKPQLSKRDLRRILIRIFGWKAANLRSPRPIPDNVSISSPLVIPLHSGLPRLVNTFLLRRATREWVNSSAHKVLWTYSPVTYGLEEYADRVIYHCVDLLANFPGIDRDVIQRAENRLAQTPGIFAAASSEVVLEHLEDSGFVNLALWENVADTAVFREAPEASRKLGGAIFAGNLTPSKLDFHLLRQLAEQGIRVRVAGPTAEGGGSIAAEYRALEAAGVEFLGMLSLPELAAEYKRSNVGIIPYLLNDYTSGVSPLKTYEYLASGLRVVSSDLPGVEERPGLVRVTRSRSEFIEAVKAADSGLSAEELQASFEVASLHSWTERGSLIRRAAGVENL